MNTDKHRFNRRKQRERRGGKGKIMGRIADLRFETSKCSKGEKFAQVAKTLYIVVRMDTDWGI
jgi:hypothetical protein